MRVLVACEHSQQVTAAFRAQGHEAFSCDLKPAAVNPQWHIKGDARLLLHGAWDLLIAHPPCTRLANSGIRWVQAKLWNEIKQAADLFLAFWNAPIPRIAIENPIMHPYAIDEIGRHPDQVIQPHFFGEPQFKATCLWLKGLPPLKRTHHMAVPKKGDPDYPAWNATHRAPDSIGRAVVRSVTFPAVAAAFAEQWGAV